ncbi:MAG: N-acetyltransferase family protein [Pseudomonadota bacterium]
MALTIRPARVGDGARIAEIHNGIIRDTVITFTTEERTGAALDARLAGGAHFWVAEAAGCVAGFATIFPFRQGPGYAHTFEHTIIVEPGTRGQGSGRALMHAVEAGARAAGGHSLMAGVSAENAAGVAFHARLGFVEVARLREVGWKFGRWHDLVLMQKFLSAPETGL